ncbi:MAG TPA: DUF2334 domain-containing protein [Steroidobacteraceae bacterium]|nr:DUF2334 domain-containing protein [Steroidobacteraceae bacterium]
MSVPAITPAERPAWLPAGKTAGVCFSIDDIHPSTSRDPYEAGGDLADGALGRLARLLERHPHLKATLAVTPDWRLRSLVPDGGLLRRIPWINRRVHWTRLHRIGHYRLDRHPRIVAYLNSLERCEAVLHGLSHTHPGPLWATEFQDQSEEECMALIGRGLEIFDAAKLRFARGFVPPAWNAPPALRGALCRLQFEFLTSARDIRTPVTDRATTAMSGLKNVSLIHPEMIDPRGLVHVSCNFQATSSFERALQILNLGGLLHVKAHIFKAGGGHRMLDGLDELYCNYLDLLFIHLHRHFGSRLWWAHLSEVALRLRRAHR